MDAFCASHIYITEEKWDPEPWSDLESASGSDSEGKGCFAPRILRRHCLGKARPYDRAASLESSVSTAASSNDFADSAGEECAAQEGQVHQSSIKVSKKSSRPPKRERDKFRKFVETLKQRMCVEGADFNFANVEVPCAYNREKVQKILDTYWHAMHLAHDR